MEASSNYPALLIFITDWDFDYWIHLINEMSRKEQSVEVDVPKCVALVHTPNIFCWLSQLRKKTIHTEKIIIFKIITQIDLMDYQNNDSFHNWSRIESLSRNKKSFYS